MIAHILLVPHESTRAALLAPGAPVWIAAYLEESAEFGWTVDPATPAADDSDDPDGYDPRERIKVAWPSLGVAGAVASALHLVLARDVAEVYEGTDRAGRASGALVRGVEARVRAASLAFEVSVLLGHEPGMDPAVALERLRSIVAPLGTLLLLDADGNEVQS